ncbi:unnamed protein product [Ranitomeya imitator]|uniref:G-protein coupled receptors family 1 profile domain-containing protein n=1 Tax=Ranitomeya imitator TaxID=111125 RepID=A0ABN9L288_9NEOB|nr:unnamed protein product [Ranitomeya imitator]
MGMSFTSNFGGDKLEYLDVAIHIQEEKLCTSVFRKSVASTQNTMTRLLVYNESGLVVLNLNETSGLDPRFSEGVKSVIMLLISLLMMVTIFGNILVMVAFIVDKSLRTQSNFFLLNLAICDFFIGAFNAPLYVLYLLTGKWMLGKHICKLWLITDYSMSTASAFNIVLISYDRFLCVTKAVINSGNRDLKYQDGYDAMLIHMCPMIAMWGLITAVVYAQRNSDTPGVRLSQWYCLPHGEDDAMPGDKKNPISSLGCVLKTGASYNPQNTLLYRSVQKRHGQTALKMASIWVVSFLLYGPAILFWEAIFGKKEMAESECMPAFSDSWSFFLGTSIFDFILPLISISHFNLSIYWSITKRSKKKRQQSAPLSSALRENHGKPPYIIATTLVLSTDHMKISVPLRKKVKKSLSQCFQTKDTLHMDNASNTFNIHVLHLSRDKKVAKSLTILVCIFAMCWAPITFLISVRTACRGNCIPSYWYDITVWILYTNSAINPILYPLCHKRFRKAFSIIFHLKKQNS